MASPSHDGAQALPATRGGGGYTPSFSALDADSKRLVPPPVAGMDHTSYTPSFSATSEDAKVSLFVADPTSPASTRAPDRSPASPEPSSPTAAVRLADAATAHAAAGDTGSSPARRAQAATPPEPGTPRQPGGAASRDVSPSSEKRPGDSPARGPSQSEAAEAAAASAARAAGSRPEAEARGLSDALRQKEAELRLVLRTITKKHEEALEAKEQEISQVRAELQDVMRDTVAKRQALNEQLDQNADLHTRVQNLEAALASAQKEEAAAGDQPSSPSAAAARDARVNAVHEELCYTLREAIAKQEEITKEMKRTHDLQMRAEVLETTLCSLLALRPAEDAEAPPPEQPALGTPADAWAAGPQQAYAAQAPGGPFPPYVDGSQVVQELLEAAFALHLPDRGAAGAPLPPGAAPPLVPDGVESYSLSPTPEGYYAEDPQAPHALEAQYESLAAMHDAYAYGLPGSIPASPTYSSVAIQAAVPENVGVQCSGEDFPRSYTTQSVQADVQEHGSGRLLDRSAVERVVDEVVARRLEEAYQQQQQPPPPPPQQLAAPPPPPTASWSAPAQECRPPSVFQWPQPPPPQAPRAPPPTPAAAAFRRPQLASPCADSEARYVAGTGLLAEVAACVDLRVRERLSRYLS